jgi:hypothetical protein
VNRRRLRSARAIVAGVASLVLAGCTLLASFDDVPGTPSAGDAAPPDAPASRDADARPTPVAPGCDPDFPIDEVGCGTLDGKVCASRAGLASYPAGQDRASDLVTCGAGGARCVHHCPIGCAAMPAGYADQCDPCAGRQDGYHCGRDLPGTPRENADLAIQCKDGRFVRGAVCGANRCASSCPRAGGPTPACCI